MATNRRPHAVPAAVRVALVAMVACLGPTAFAQVQDRDSYDIQSTAWNGLNELVRIAQEANVDLRPSATLDWGEMRPGDGLLVLYPLSHIELQDLSGFLEDGGRLAVMDDFGDAAPLFRWFQVTRTTDVHGQSRTSAVPGLLIANRRLEHPLSDGVDSLVTNEPVALSHPRLAPVFALDDAPRLGIVLAGQIGRGRLVVGGDPSVLINTMMRFPGNRRFARNLLTYLAGRPGGRVNLIHSSFASRGIYRGRRAQEPMRQMVQNLNETLAHLTALANESPMVRWIAWIVAVAAAALLARKTWGSQPSDRFGPTGPSGVAAGVGEKAQIFGARGANLLYPSLIAKRYFERGLLRAVGLKPPTDIGVVITHARGRLTDAQQTELRALVLELDELSIPAHEGGPSGIAPRRFLSLWHRIGAILAALGDA